MLTQGAKQWQASSPGDTVERDEGSAVFRFKEGLVEDGVAAICTKRRCVKLEPYGAIARSHGRVRRSSFCAWQRIAIDYRGSENQVDFPGFDAVSILHAIVCTHSVKPSNTVHHAKTCGACSFHAHQGAAAGAIERSKRLAGPDDVVGPSFNCTICLSNLTSQIHLLSFSVAKTSLGKRGALWYLCVTYPSIQGCSGLVIVVQTK